MSRLFFTELRNSSLLQDHPQAAADLIWHAMVGHTGPFYDCREAVSTFEKPEVVGAGFGDVVECGPGRTASLGCIA
jgi:hypothetical protein